MTFYHENCMLSECHAPAEQVPLRCMGKLTDWFLQVYYTLFIVHLKIHLHLAEMCLGLISDQMLSQMHHRGHLHWQSNL